MRLCRLRTQVILQKAYNLISIILIIYAFYYKSNDSKNYSSLKKKSLESLSDNFKTSELPRVFIISATYRRWTQKADLTRIAHSFILQNTPIYWIIVEDTVEKYPHKILTNFKNYWEDFSQNYQPCRSCLQIEISSQATPEKYKLDHGNDPNWLFPRGAEQRNKGLLTLENVLSSEAGSNIDNFDYLMKNSVVYFADDDNTYREDLFEHLLKVINSESKELGLIPVGIVGGLKWEGPLCNKQFSGPLPYFHTAWKPERPFPIDMAGFVLKLPLLLKNKPFFSSKTRRGYLESDFLLKYLDVTEYGVDQIKESQKSSTGDVNSRILTYVPNDKINAMIYEKFVTVLKCDEILVWHTQTKIPKDKDELRLISQGQGSLELEF